MNLSFYFRLLIAGFALNLSAATVCSATTLQFAYVTNLLGDNLVTYAINQATGALTAGINVVVGSRPKMVTVDPTGRFAYVVTDYSNDVLVYTINQSTGALTAGSPVTMGSNPISVSVDPTGKFAYVPLGLAVSVYSINQTTGALMGENKVPIAKSVVSFAVDPTGKFAYATHGNYRDISTYRINQTTGALTAGVILAVGNYPNSLSFDPAGKFAYVTTQSAKVMVYTIDQSTGALTAGSPVMTNSIVNSFTVDPTGKFAYGVAYGSVLIYTINQTTGALTSAGFVQVNGSSVTFDSSGKFAYVLGGSGNVSSHTFNSATGGLTAGTTVYLSGYSQTFPSSIAIATIGTPPLSGSGTTSTISDARVFAYAEGNAPSLFPGTGTAGQYQQYSYRHYPDSGNYLIVDTAGILYILGPYTHNALTTVGPVATFATGIIAWETTQASPINITSYTEPSLNGSVVALNSISSSKGQQITYWGLKDSSGNPSALTESLLRDTATGDRVRTIYGTHGFPKKIINEKTGATVIVLWGLSTADFRLYDANRKFVEGIGMTVDSAGNIVTDYLGNDGRFAGPDSDDATGELENEIQKGKDDAKAWWNKVADRVIDYSVRIAKKTVATGATVACLGNLACTEAASIVVNGIVTGTIASKLANNGGKGDISHLGVDLSDPDNQIYSSERHDSSGNPIPPTLTQKVTSDERPTYTPPPIYTPPTCTSFQTLQNGQCVNKLICGAYQKEQNGVCVPNCTSAQEVVSGVCVARCASNQTRQSGVCVSQQVGCQPDYMPQPGRTGWCRADPNGGCGPDMIMKDAPGVYGGKACVRAPPIQAATCSFNTKAQDGICVALPPGWKPTCNLGVFEGVCRSSDQPPMPTSYGPSGLHYQNDQCVYQANGIAYGTSPGDCDRVAALTNFCGAGFELGYGKLGSGGAECIKTCLSGEIRSNGQCVPPPAKPTTPATSFGGTVIIAPPTYTPPSTPAPTSGGTDGFWCLGCKY